MLNRTCRFLGLVLVALWLAPSAGADEPTVINSRMWQRVFFLDVINNCSFPVRYDQDLVWVEPGKFRRMITSESGQNSTIKLNFSAKDRVQQRVETYMKSKDYGEYFSGMRVEVRDEHFPKSDAGVTPPPITLEKAMFTEGIWVAASGYKLSLHHTYEQKAFSGTVFDPDGNVTYSLKGKLQGNSFSLESKTDKDEVTLLLGPNWDTGAAPWEFKASVELKSRDPETGKWSQLDFAGPMSLTPGGDAPANRSPGQLWPVGRIETKDVKPLDTGSLKTPDIGLHLVRTAKTPEEEQRAIENVFKTLSAAGVNFKRNLSPGLTPRPSQPIPPRNQ